MKIRLLMMGLALAGLAACDAPAEKPADAPAKAEAPAEEKAPEKSADKPAEKEADPHAAFTNLSPDKVKGLIAGKDCVPIDANGKKTRDKYGVLPGAVLLTDYKSFAATELPKDKDAKLVFYCGGQMCTAAPKAAKVAKDAGYKDVNVMRAGIRGWVDAGNDVAKPTG